MYNPGLKIRPIFPVCVFMALFFMVAPVQIVLSKSSPVAGRIPSGPFVAVFVDDATEKILGPFPYDRSKYAQALAALRKAKAKAVVIKYFLDQSKPGDGDDRLANEMKTLPVLLQARLDPAEPHPNPLPSRLDRGPQIKGDKDKLLSGQSGWIPLEKFSRYCTGIGFVDISSKDDVLNIPLVLRYQNRVVPSLELAALELALGKTAQIQLGRRMVLDGYSLPLDASSQVRVHLPAQDKIDSISFIDVMLGKFDRKRVEGKIVILGFDAKETPTLPTFLGPLRIHRLFFYSLVNLFEQLEEH
jgi:CHASE2 domain-containing sensor protein